MSDNKKINILVVDDIPASLLAFEAVLSELNENIVKATTGEAALAFLLKNECALIILDLQMSGMDGLQTAQLIRQNSRTKSTPIIFTTTLHSDEDVLKAYTLGAVDYLVKPIPPEILRAKVYVFVELYRKNLELREKRQKEQEASLAQKRLTFLSQASNILSSTLDYETTLTAVARLAVPHIADWCLVDILEEEGRVSRLSVAHREQDKEAIIKELSFPNDPDADFAVSKVLKTGQPIIIQDVQEAQLETFARNHGHLQLLKELGIKSTMIVPLWNNSRTFGAITFVSADNERHYHDEDLIFAEDLAHRAALAIENARNYLRLQEALTTYHTIEERLYLLSEASARLLSIMENGSLLPELLEMARKLIAADAYAVWRYHSASSQWQIDASSGLSHTYQENALKTMELEAIPERPLFLENVEESKMVADRVALYHSEGIRSLLVAPLMIRGQRSGTITLYFQKQPAIKEIDIRVVSALTNIVSVAITAAELHEEQGRTKSA